MVTAVIPCRKKRRFIEPCHDSLLANDFPKDRLEVLVVDGMSEDGTRPVLDEWARRHSALRVLDNPKGTIPAAMNIGIRAARGDVIVKIDAHSTYRPDYISSC